MGLTLRAIHALILAALVLVLALDSFLTEILADLDRLVIWVILMAYAAHEVARGYDRSHRLVWALDVFLLAVALAMVIVYWTELR